MNVCREDEGIRGSETSLMPEGEDVPRKGGRERNGREPATAEALNRGIQVRIKEWKVEKKNRDDVGMPGENNGLRVSSF
jgi:hypothetical protein